MLHDEKELLVRKLRCAELLGQLPDGTFDADEPDRVSPARFVTSLLQRQWFVLIPFLISLFFFSLCDLRYPVSGEARAKPHELAGQTAER